MEEGRRAGEGVEAMKKRDRKESRGHGAGKEHQESGRMARSQQRRDVDSTLSSKLKVWCINESVEENGEEMKELLQCDAPAAHSNIREPLYRIAAFRMAAP